MFVIPNRIFDPAFECMVRGDREKFQATHLRRLVEQAQKIPFYRRRFAAKNILPESLHTIDDLRRLPFTTDRDLHDGYPFGFIAAPRPDLARIHISGGDQPIFTAFTRQDMKLRAALCARLLVAGGLSADQLVQEVFGCGLPTDGFGLYGGIERVGAAVLPVFAGDMERQIALLRDAAIDTVVCSPSYAEALAEAVGAVGLAGRLPLRFAHLSGEFWSEERREALEEKLHIRASYSCGISPVVGHGMSGECAARCGLHVQEDHFVVECIDPETLEPVKDGDHGEVVVTALTQEASPIIRYRTGEIACLLREKCECGRTTLRMSWVKRHVNGGAK